MRGVSESMASGHSPMLLQAVASALGDVWPGRLFPTGTNPSHHRQPSTGLPRAAQARPPLTTGTEPGEREREIRADLTSLQWLLSVLH